MIPARVDCVAARPHRTALRNGTVAIETVEHCLAALYGLGIDNLRIELNADELPGSDASAAPFVKALTRAGTTEQDVERQVLKIRTPVCVSEGDATLAALPSEQDKLDIIYELDYGPDNPIGRQVFAFTCTEEGFRNEIAQARTFLLEEEARLFQSQGLGAHLGPHDLLVWGQDGPIDNDLRYPDECVRHKIVDLLGDLYLLGRPVFGRIIAYKSGHSLNHALVRKLIEQVRQVERGAALTAAPLLDIRAIQRILPHRYPFLLVDRIIEIDGDRRIIGVKNVTFNEQFFQGHFPSTPMMPAVLVVEAMAQLSGVLFAQKLEHTGKLGVILSMDKVKIRRAVTPGDQLVLEAETVRLKKRTGHCRCKAYVGDNLAAEADIKFMLVDADSAE